MKIELKSVHIENFKGIKNKDIAFADKTNIKGKNAVGKTTIVDAVLWLLFGKNSQYVEKFDLRPLDESGKMINFIDIIVSAVLSIDGKEIELKKTQKQNWVKKHGSDFPVFQGNINSYEIDGYPKADKEYKEFINNIISEDLFKMLTSPLYFPNLKAKEQREIIMRMVVTKTDAEFAKEFGGYDELISELEKAPSTEDISKKYAKAKKELDAKSKELPIRIDELSKQIVDYDVAELELAKKSLMERKSVKTDTTELDKLKKDSMDLQFEVSKYAQDFERIANDKLYDFSRTIKQLKFDLEEKERNINATKSMIANATEIDEQLKNRSSELGAEYKRYSNTAFDESKWVFDEESTVCKMCGQKLPADKIEQIKADFEKRKAEEIKKFNEGKEVRLKALVDEGWQIKAKRETLEKEITNNNAKLDIYTAELKALTAKLEETEKNKPTVQILAEDVVYAELVKSLKETNEKIAEIERKSFESVNAGFEVDAELESICAKISQFENNAVIEERIEELTKEQRETAQKIADCEKMLYLVETFTKQKLESISDSVNSKFKLVNFKLFDVQINGGVVETCECTINGVPYGDLNNGHKIVAGMDIANTLSDIFDKHVFMFIDNAESINEFNMPAMDNQLIRLVVTEDKELIVE